MSMKNSNDAIGNRSSDLPVCSAVPPPTAPLRASGSMVVLIITNNNAKHVYNYCKKQLRLDSVVAVITRLGAKHSRNRGSIPVNGKGFVCV
jgi:hypothetical protein